MSEKRNTLPQGWEWKKLGEVVDFQGGSQPPKNEFTDKCSDGYIRLIQIRDYKTDNHIVYVKKDAVRKFCNENDIMIGRYGPPVFQILRGIKGAYNVALMKACFDENILLNDYLYYYLQNSTIQNYIIGLSQRSAGQSGVNKEALENYDFALPPLEEQRRIVGKLDGLFDKINKSIALLAESIASGSSLMPSALNEVFEELGEKWKFEEWKNIVNIKNGKDYKAISNQKGTYPIYGSGGIIGYVDEFLCNENSVIIGRKGTINKPLFVKEKFWNIDTAFGLESKQEKLKPLYLYYFCLNFDFLKLNTATTLPSLTKSKLQEIQIPLPPLDIQTQTVAYLDALQLKAEALKKAQVSKKEELLALKASLLESAFKGEL